MPENMSEYMPEDIPDRMPEDIILSARAKGKNIEFEKFIFIFIFYKLKNINCQLIPLNRKIDTLAKYLKQQYWAYIQYLPPDKVNKREIVDI